MKLLVLLMLLGSSNARVVHSFKECSQFFLAIPIAPQHGKPKMITPTILKGERYKQICQRYKEEDRFATLYDTQKRIPVYSAYTYRGIDYALHKDPRWKFEPQLDLPITKSNAEMSENIQTDQLVNQALNKDYENNYHPEKFTRGHVFPKSYAANDRQADSTFTLTNAAPQTEESNSEWAKQVERPMKKNIKVLCVLDANTPAYIVTGVAPSQRWLPIERENQRIVKGINVPRYFWSAFNCISKTTKQRISHAYIAEQAFEITPGQKVEFNSTGMLQDKDINHKITKLYKKDFKVFG